MDINNPLEAIYAFAEQTYIRMQAGDLLMRCMDSGTVRPMQDLVENLVLAGPQSLGTLHEILLETGQRRAQIQDDMQRLYGEFQNTLNKFGIRRTEDLPDAHSFANMDDVRFYQLIIRHGILEEDRQTDCFQKFQETQDLMNSLIENIELLQNIEGYLKDWLWGLAYQSVRDAAPTQKEPTNWTL
jgi:hypothetical protein